MKQPAAALKHTEQLLVKDASIEFACQAKDRWIMQNTRKTFILEGLYALRRISRSEERGFAAEERKRAPDPEESPRARQKRQFN